MIKEAQELLKGLKKMQKHCIEQTGLNNDCEKCMYLVVCDALQEEDLPDEWDLPPLEEED